tara:strand:- start:1075 stop:1332 length:258 start_codon:yes stop_codon:yes gene_type:complete
MSETEKYIIEYLSSLMDNGTNSKNILINYEKGNDIFLQELNIDSLEIMEFIMDLEDRYNIEMDYDELISQETVKKFVEYTIKKIQ